MIDTAGIAVKGSIWAKKIPVGWAVRPHGQQFIQNDQENGPPLVHVSTQTMEHLATGLKVFGNMEKPYQVECSLPRLYFGDNGHLLKAQIELDAAQREMWKIFSEVATLPVLFEFKRLDFVWQFARNADEFVSAFRNYDHPEVRGDVRFSHNSKDHSITWGGRRSLLRAVVYDKEREQLAKLGLLSDLAGCPGNIARLEFMLRGRKLRMAYNGTIEPVTKLDYRTCYDVFRNEAQKLQPEAIMKANSMPEYLANQIKKYGPEAFEDWARGKERHAVARMKKAIRSASPSISGIDLRELLPMGHPPEPIEVITHGVGHGKEAPVSASEAALSFLPLEEGKDTALDSNAALKPVFEAQAA